MKRGQICLHYQEVSDELEAREVLHNYLEDCSKLR